MEEERNNGIFIGVLGALIGALVGTIPWLVVVVFAGRIIAILSVAIVAGSYYGYKLTKAKIDSRLPWIVSICSLIAVTIVTFVGEPIGEMIINDIEINSRNLNIIYSNSELQSALFRDYMVSILFTVIGIAGIVMDLRKQIKAGANNSSIQFVNKNR